jgi:hypothetical protein
MESPQKRILVVAPLQAEFEDVYLVIKSAIEVVSEQEGESIVAFRADETSNPRSIIGESSESIRGPDLILVDVSGGDPSVTYKLGYAHALDRKVIILSQDFRSSPLDVYNYRQLVYDRSRMVVDLRPRLVAAITEALHSETDPAQWPRGQSPTALSDQPPVKRKDVFISYSHADKEYLDRLLVHLKPLEREGLINSWDDTRIEAGQNWQDEIQKALNSAGIAILLVSADYLASDFIINNELPPLLEAAKERGTKIIPVIVKPSRFAQEKNLSRFQAINDPENPLIKMEEDEREELYVKVGEVIEQNL